jgi:hypothetical protein
MYTIKMLTHGMIEGRAPICFLLERHLAVTLDSVLVLLHRLANLYAVKFAVSKILATTLKAFHSHDVTRLVKLQRMVAAFVEEHKFYGRFIYKGGDLAAKINDELDRSK